MPAAADPNQLKLARTQHQEIKPDVKTDNPMADQDRMERMVVDHLAQTEPEEVYVESIRHMRSLQYVNNLRITAEELAEGRRRAYERQVTSIEEGIAAGAHEVSQRVDTRVNDTRQERAFRNLWSKALAERERQHPKEFEVRNAAEALMTMSRSGAADRSATDASNEGREAAARARMGDGMTRWMALNPGFEFEDQAAPTSSHDTQAEQPVGRPSESVETEARPPRLSRPLEPTKESELKRLNGLKESAEPDDTEMDEPPGADEA